MSNLPLLSSEIEPPEILGWFHKLSSFLGETVTITRNPLTNEQLASYEKTGTVVSGRAVSLVDSERFAMNAVFAEQDLVTAKLDHCAKIVASHLISTKMRTATNLRMKFWMNSPHCVT
jgi:hypothetical protein